MHSVKDYTCKYCGHYLIDRHWIGLTSEIDKNETKFKIACILNERRLKGQSGVALSNKTDKDRIISNCPMISVSELLDKFPKRASDFLNRILLNLSRLPEQPFDIIRLNIYDTSADRLHLFALDKIACETIIRELVEQGLVRCDYNDIDDRDINLTAKCWEKIEHLQQTGEIHNSNKENTSMEWDVFICHASEDKEGFVEPLANALEEADIKVWYDRFELQLGDRLRDKIDEGLANSRYGVVVLSNSFFKKQWTRTELDALVTQENQKGEKVILPIWHGIGIEEVGKSSPILASKLAAQSSDSLESIVAQIEKVLNKNSTREKPAKGKIESAKTKKPTPATSTEKLLIDPGDITNKLIWWLGQQRGFVLSQTQCQQPVVWHFDVIDKRCGLTPGSSKECLPKLLNSYESPFPAIVENVSFGTIRLKYNFCPYPPTAGRFPRTSS